MFKEIILSNEMVFILDIFLSLLAGFAIGLERESRGKDAGIGTHSLVIVGAMLFAFLSMKISPEDPARIAAQIVTGIGFLGAGLIMKDDSSGNVKNLTTAASLWFAGGVGMAFGFGYYSIGLISALVAVFIPRIYFENGFPKIK